MPRVSGPSYTRNAKTMMTVWSAPLSRSLRLIWVARDSSLNVIVIIHHSKASMFFVVLHGPRGLTFRWWGCCDLCFWHKPTELAHSLLFCSCVCFCLYGPFNCISFYKFSRQLSAFSLCSSDFISALLVLSTTYLLRIPLQPCYNPLWSTGLKATIQ